MKKLAIVCGLCFLISCNKQDKHIDDPVVPAEETGTDAKGGGKPTPTPTYTTYTILQGQHYCDPRPLKSVRTSEMKFVAKFDESAIYQTVDPNNQYDINKLWGFSEGLNNQYNSARIGWGWSDEALRLYAYAYVKGVRHSQEISTVPIGVDINCSIKVSGSTYIFTVNSTSVTLPRGLSTSSASGYQQYPYFGGDETAPHTIRILIRSL
jgi:hypothetical protein